jgi:hypothetical protein
MRINGDYLPNENHASPTSVIGVRVYDFIVKPDGRKITRWLVKEEGNGGATLNSIMWVEGGVLRAWFPDEIQDEANKQKR